MDNQKQPSEWIIQHPFLNGAQQFLTVQGGFTMTERWVVKFSDGRSCFIKCSVDELTATFLRAEHLNYTRISGEWMPEMLAFFDNGTEVLLAIEDLSTACWDFDWTNERVQSVLRTLREVNQTEVPEDMPRLATSTFIKEGWSLVAKDPVPFLRLGLCSAKWLDSHLPRLIELTQQVSLDGNDLTHLDVRKDNMCLVEPSRGQGVVLVDWNWSVVGNGEMDIAFWLPSLSMQGGPKPQEVLPNRPELASIVSGYFAARAGIPPTEGMKQSVRDLQLFQLKGAFPWVYQSL